MTDPRTAPTVKTQVGRYYKDRKGRVRGPIAASRNKVYPRCSPSDNISWTRDGQYMKGGNPHDRDLIEEVNADGSPITSALDEINTIFARVAQDAADNAKLPPITSATTSAPGPADPLESLRAYAKTLGLHLSHVEAMTQNGARVKVEWPE